MKKFVSPSNSPRRFEESQEDTGEDYRGVERLLTRLGRLLRTDNHFFQLFLGKKHRKLLSFGDFRRGLANLGIFPKLAYLYAVFELLDRDKDVRFPFEYPHHTLRVVQIHTHKSRVDLRKQT